MTEPEPIYDVVVVGGGPGGYVAAIRCAQLGLSVAIAEAHHWGGVCLNVGCIPTKSLLHNAEIVRLVSDHAEELGLRGTFEADYSAAQTRSQKVAAGRAQGVGYLLRKNRITTHEGRGRFVGPNRLEVQLSDGDVASVSFRHAIIATGARPRLPEGMSRSSNVVTYEEQIVAATVPASILIVGGGAIGVEMADVLEAYGSEVTILERLERLLPNEDVDSSAEVERAYRRLGIRIVTSATVDRLVDSGSSVTATWSDPTTAGTTTEEFDRVLVATGFAPNSDDLGLALAGVGTDGRGAITIDAHMRTSAPHIFAIGDVTMKMQLAHVAEAMGTIAAEAIAGVPTMTIDDYRVMPRATFSHPQVASFGLTEREARDCDAGVRVVRFPFSANGKAHAIGSSKGFVKLIASSDGLLLGGHIVGPDASEMLAELTLAQRWDLGSFELSRNVHIHPTLGEAVQEALLGLEGHMIHL